MFSKLVERIKYFFFDVENDWEIGISSHPITTFLTSNNIPEIKWLPMPKYVYRADPFGYQIKDKYYIFYEEFDKNRSYATINCKILDSNLQEIDNRIIIDEGLHISFPYIFEYNSEYYLLPETWVMGKVILYKAVKFPFEWKQEKILLDLYTVDNILIYEDNYWWLFYTKDLFEKGNTPLCVRKNANLMGNWVNSKELVISNERYNSRCGGSVFKYNNELYRVSQNCTESYGKSVVINKIIELSDINFRETAIKEIYLNFNGFHTLSSCENFSLVDRKRERLYIKSPNKIFASIKQKFKNL